MRHTLLGALAAALLLLLPGVASGQDAEDPCYVDPTSVECLGVGGADDAVDDDGEVEADDGDEVDVDVLGETLGRGGAAPAGVLSRTGVETGTLAAIVVALLAAGGALLFTTRRRRSA